MAYVVPSVAASAPGQSTLSVNAAVKVVVTANAARVSLYLENPSTNTTTMFFKWDADPATTPDAQFILAPGGKAFISISQGDYVKGELRVIGSAAGPSTLLISDRT